MKKALTALSVAGLLAGLGLTAGGCRWVGGKSSCSSCGDKAAQAKTSCSAGSCSAGSCGAKAGDTKTTGGAGQ